ALLGIDEGGLTASAEEIEGYLRTDALGTWKQSADVTPDVPSPKRPSQPPEEDAEEDAPVRRTARARAPGPTQTVSRKPPAADEAPSNRKARQREPEPKAPRLRQTAEPSPNPAPEPELVVRP